MSTKNEQHLLLTGLKQTEYYYMTGVGHAFDLKGAPTYNAQAAADAQQKTLDFFKAKLP